MTVTGAESGSWGRPMTAEVRLKPRGKTMPSSWVEIDLSALRHNFFQAKNRMSSKTRILGVVKSDAYGHGMIPVARELAACGAHFFAVSKLWEAAELHAANLGLPVVVLLGVEPAEMVEAVAIGVRPVVFRMDHAKALSRVACSLNKEAIVHLKVDTGMGRLGVPCAEVESFLDELIRLPGIRIEGILSHFAVADESDKSYCELQLGRFRQVLQTAAARGLPVYGHIANSAGLLDLPHAHFQLVRPGIMLYGSPPSDELLQPADLRPVMHFKSTILHLKNVPEGQPIGYGRTYVTRRPSRIATVPVGYDDGYSRLLSNRGQVLVRGKRAPVVGRISMNMITVDVTHIPEAAEDDEVVLLGCQEEECITGEEIAALCGTISYEIFCSFGRNRYKTFLNAGASGQ